MDAKTTFSGLIPEYYDTCLGPAYFDVFAAHLAQRLPARPVGDVLEVACGTGRATRYLLERIDPPARLVATDLSKGMLDYARGKLGEGERLEWREADATALPFGDAGFGAVVCAFGLMFVPDKAAALREARRVLRDDGLLLFDTWDRIEENAHARVVADLVEGMFPGDDEVRFRAPWEMHDPAGLEKLLAQAGFRDVRIEKRRLPVGGVSARTMATGTVRGTPRSLLFEKRGVSLDEMVEKVTAALASVGGDPYRQTAQALIVEARPGR